MSEERTEYSTDRPYEVHSTDGAADTGFFIKWLQKVGESDADPVGVAAGVDSIALSQGEDIYLVSSSEGGQFARAALAAAIMGDNPPHLVATNAEDTLFSLTLALAEHYPTRELFGRLAQCMMGDLLSCARTNGHAPAARDLNLTDEAYTARLLEPQYQWESPAYYTAVSLPLARLRAEYRLFGKKDAPAEWWVSYPDLWIRVLVRYTADPTLTYILDEGQEPLTAITRLFEWSPEQTVAVLLWHICGRTVDVMAEIAPISVEKLPDDLPAIGELWNRRLPSLWLGITGLMQGYQRDRLARTLYGRKFRGGQHPGTASAHTILGTVQDLMEVAGVTFWNQRPGPSVMIKGIDGFTVDPVQRVVGVGPAAVEEREQWIETLRHLAPLAAPLGTVSLSPTVVRPPEESSPPAEIAVGVSVAPAPSGAGRAKTKRGGKRASTTTRSPKESPAVPASSRRGSASPAEAPPAAPTKSDATPAPAKRRGHGAHSKGDRSGGTGGRAASRK